MTSKILTVGVYDYFHYGHLRLFEQIKERYPDSCLIVAVHESECIKKYKPDANVFYSTAIRCEIVKSLRQVDEVITYQAVNDIVRKVDFDVFAVGEDQNHAGFLDAIAWCESHGKYVMRLKRTPNISSTEIKGSFEFRK